MSTCCVCGIHLDWEAPRDDMLCMCEPCADERLPDEQWLMEACKAIEACREPSEPVH